MRKLISLITLFSFSIQAATITDDKLTVGKKASASAKEIVFDTNDGAANKKLSVDKITKKLSITSDEAIVGDGTASDKALTFNRGGSNAQVKWNEVTDKLQFSNDGTTFKDLGTGGGGGGSTGVNVLTNDSFEDAVGGVLTDWSNTGGTLTQVSYTNSVEGDAKYFQFVATTSGQYFEPSKASTLKRSLVAIFNFLKSTWVKFPTLSFVCPAAGATFKIRVTSLAAGTLQGDKAYLGSNQNLVSVGKGTVGQVMSVSTASCPASTLPADGSAVSRVTYSQLFSAIGITHGQGNGSTTFNLPDYRGRFLRGVDGSASNDPGKASRTAMNTGGNTGNAVGSLQGQSTAKNGLTITDPGHAHGNYVGTGAGSGNSVSSTYANQSITGGGPPTTSNTTGITLNAGDSETRPINAYVNYCVVYQEVSSDIAVSNEQASWFIDANIGGGNPVTGSSIISSYTEVTNSSLDLVLNTSKGSAAAEIPCSGTNPSTGLTCSSGSEGVGIAFIPPFAGSFEACVSFLAGAGGGAATSLGSTFQLISTPNNAQTILEEGADRTPLSLSLTTATDAVYFPVKNCGTFTFADTSKKTIRLMFEQSTTSSTGIFADRSAGNGQRDIHITVKPLLSAYNRPILTGDQVTSPGVINPKVYSARVNNSGVITNNYGGLLNSCSWSPVGFLTCSFVAGKFTTDPNCFISSSASEHGLSNSPTTSSIGIFTASSSGVAATATTVEIFCHGY